MRLLLDSWEKNYWTILNQYWGRGSLGFYLSSSLKSEVYLTMVSSSASVNAFDPRANTFY